jgi:O-antigen/teichoic acid export membrane protein
MNSVLNYVLIPKYGTIGSAIASLISMFMASVLILVISTKIEKVGFRYIKIYAITFLFMAISSVCFLNINISFAVFLLVKLLLALIVILFLCILYKKELIILLDKVKVMAVKLRRGA